MNNLVVLPDDRIAEGHIAPYRVIPEPRLRFGPGPDGPTHIHPLLGLLKFGPFGRPPTEGPIRIATISVGEQRTALYRLLRELREEHSASDRPSYVPTFPGFERVFGVDVVPAQNAHVTLADVMHEGGTAHDSAARKLAAAVRELHASRDEWDVIAFFVPRTWEPIRTSPDGRYELHDRLKATAAPLGCPIQVLREASAASFRHLASLAWRLSIALYAKAGGTPWRMEATSSEETAYIGLAYAIRGGTSDEFVTCCSQVFDGEGGGMEFVAYNVGANRDLENPHLTRDEMRAVMARSLRLYQLRHAGRTPRRAVVHKTIRWREAEIDGVFDAWSSCESIECVTVHERSDWRGVRIESGSSEVSLRPGDYPVRRGTAVPMSGSSALLWVSGTAEGMSLRGGIYNPSVKGLPAPSVVVRDAGVGPLEATCADVLALSKLDWNNDAPFDAMPVTIEYSQRLAKVISRVPHLPDDVYQYRLFM